MPIRKTTDRQKEDWILANKDFVQNNHIAAVYEKMQKDGLYSTTYSLKDAYMGLEHRIERAFSKKEKE